MPRPKITPAITSREKLFTKITIAFALGFILLLFFYYPQLPEKIPTHFNEKGEIDGWGNRNSIFALPLIGLLVMLLMFYLAKFPHIYNYNKKITPQNAPYEYQRARELLRMMNMVIAGVFFLLTWEICASAIRGATIFGVWSVLLIVGAILFPILYYYLTDNKEN